MSGSNEGKLIVGAILGFGSGLWTFFKGFRTYREYRVVEDTPVMPVRSIPMGLVRVHGKAKGEELVTSPVTHTPAYFYKVEIEKWKEDRNNRGWTKYRTDTNGVKFYLEDATGKVLADAQGAELDLLVCGQREIGGIVRGVLSKPQSMGASEEELRQYITQVTAQKIGSFVERRLVASRPGRSEDQEKARQAALQLFKSPLGSAEFLETLLAAQAPSLREHLTAAGPQSDPQKEQARLALIEASQHPPGSPEFRAGVQKVMGMTGAQGTAAPGMQKIFSVSVRFGSNLASASMFPGASGRFRFTEYCILPDHWYDVTGTCAENPNPRDQHDRNLMMKGQNEPTFLISYRSSKEVESRLRKRAAFQIFGGAGLALVCLAYLLYKFGLFR